MNTQWQFVICPINSMQQSSSSATISHSASHEIPIIWKYKLQYCVHTSSQHFPVSLIWIQLIPFHLKSLRFILMLSSCLHLDCQGSLITSAFWIHICHLPSPSHPPWFDNLNISWWGAQIMNLNIMQFSSLLLPPPSQVQIVSSLPNPPHILTWYSSPIVRDKVAHLPVCLSIFCLFEYMQWILILAIWQSTLKNVGQTWLWTQQCKQTLTLHTTWRELKWLSQKATKVCI
jgi:hypothetical protein